MSGREENTDDQVIKVLCEKSKLLAFVEGQNEYEKSMKRIFNAGGPLNKPKVCIKPKSADEVCNELEYASASHLHVSVLGGGHDPKGKLCNPVSLQCRRILAGRVDIYFYRMFRPPS